jgi:hypothetical protein
LLACLVDIQLLPAAAAAAAAGGGWQVADLIRAKRAAEEKAVQLSQELTQTRNTANQVLQRLLTPNPSGAVPNGQYGGVASQQVTWQPVL